MNIGKIIGVVAGVTVASSVVSLVARQVTGKHSFENRAMMTMGLTAAALDARIRKTKQK